MCSVLCGDWYKMTISAIENVAADFMRPGHRVIWGQPGDYNGKIFPPQKIFVTHNMDCRWPQHQLQIGWMQWDRGSTEQLLHGSCMLSIYSLLHYNSPLLHFCVTLSQCWVRWSHTGSVLGWQKKCYKSRDWPKNKQALSLAAPPPASITALSAFIPSSRH